MSITYKFGSHAMSQPISAKNAADVAEFFVRHELTLGGVCNAAAIHRLCSDVESGTVLGRCEVGSEGEIIGAVLAVRDGSRYFIILPLRVPALGWALLKTKLRKRRTTALNVPSSRSIAPRVVMEGKPPVRWGSDGAETARVMQVVVDKSAQGRGLGVVLQRSLFEDAGHAGLQFMIGQVALDNMSAIIMDERAGYDFYREQDYWLVVRVLTKSD